MYIFVLLFITLSYVCLLNKVKAIEDFKHGRKFVIIKYFTLDYKQNKDFTLSSMAIFYTNFFRKVWCLTKAKQLIDGDTRNGKDPNDLTTSPLTPFVLT